MSNILRAVAVVVFLHGGIVMSEREERAEADAGHGHRERCSDGKLKAIFNFGDSNSDTGGFYAAFPSPRGPYGMTFFHKPTGRASDGRLVIDFLAEALGLPFLSPYLQSIGSDFRHGANYATLASTVLLPDTSLFVSGISPFSLAIQLNQMKDFKSKALLPPPSGQDLPSPDAFAKSLYTLDIGQNDFTSKLAGIGIEGVNKYLALVASQIVDTIKELYGEGGRLFMVANLAPIGCFPAFLVELPHSSSDLDQYGCMTSYNNAVLDYNAMLKEKLAQARALLPNASFVYLDTHSIKLHLFRHPNHYGLSYGTKACCGHGGGLYNFDPRVFCGNSKMIDGRNVTARACPDPENYVSWDGIHATDAANKIIASAILKGGYFDPPDFSLSNICSLNTII